MSYEIFYYTELLYVEGGGSNINTCILNSIEDSFRNVSNGSDVVNSTTSSNVMIDYITDSDIDMIMKDYEIALANDAMEDEVGAAVE